MSDIASRTENQTRPEIHCARRGVCGHIRLDRPEALNALTLNMVREIARALDAWERDPAIQRVVIEGAGGKAFSAGGDIRLLYKQGRAGDHASQLTFWREEYILNERIKTYPKPYVALIDGIVMGGGVGVSIHGSHRIAGDRFAFAMPEVGIGFFPDVGATFFLPRLPGETGTYLALTGARAKAGDAAALGLADAFVPSARFADLASALCETGEVASIIASFAGAPPPSALNAHRAIIDRCFSANAVAEIVSRLERESDPFAAETSRAIRSKSPTSLAIALRQMRVGKGMDIAQAMQTEYRIVSRVCRGREFIEGIRAAIIDKDQAPKWQHSSLQDVSDAEVDSFFAALADDELTFPSSAAASKSSA